MPNIYANIFSRHFCSVFYYEERKADMGLCYMVSIVKHLDLILWKRNAVCFFDYAITIKTPSLKVVFSDMLDLSLYSVLSVALSGNEKLQCFFTNCPCKT